MAGDSYVASDGPSLTCPPPDQFTVMVLSVSLRAALRFDEDNPSFKVKSSEVAFSAPFILQPWSVYGKVLKKTGVRTQI
jgi:hypothetical protein